MRFVVFLLAVLASLITGFFGWFWLDYQFNREAQRIVEKDYKDYSVYMTMIMPDYNDFEATSGAAIFLLAGGALGLLGSLFTLMRRGRHGAVLMILAVVGPALFSPLTLMFTGLLGFAGILSVFIRPLPPPAEEAV